MNTKIIKIFIVNNDEKTRSWADAAPGNTAIVPVASKPWSILPRLLFKFATEGKPTAIVFRYLNDYRSITKTMLRTLIELSAMFLCKSLSIRILWICHNIERESYQWYPEISRFRRRVFANSAQRIIVTDPLLIEAAQIWFPKHESKLGSITFGPMIEKKDTPKARCIKRKVLTFIANLSQSSSKKPLIGFSAGRANWKTRHFEEALALVEHADALDEPIGLVLVGDICSHYDRYLPSLCRDLARHPRVLLIDDHVDLNEPELAEVFDFVWKVVIDQSVSATIYHAHAMAKPILTLPFGFTAKAVSQYGLGHVLKEDYSDLTDAFALIRHWQPNGTTTFTLTHDWSVAAARLVKYATGQAQDD